MQKRWHSARHDRRTIAEVSSIAPVRDSDGPAGDWEPTGLSGESLRLCNLPSEKSWHSNAAFSSAVRATDVETRQLSTRIWSSKIPKTVFVLPMSTANNMCDAPHCVFGSIVYRGSVGIVKQKLNRYRHHDERKNVSAQSLALSDAAGRWRGGRLVYAAGSVRP
jgi:hypothetical protein